MKKNYFVVNKLGHCRLCDKPDEADKFMVCCDECDRWFHLKCVGLSQAPQKTERWTCIKCTDLETLLKNPASASTVAPTSPTSPTVNQNDQLSRSLCRPSLMELPYFDGSHKVWPRFKMTFNQTTLAGGFSDLENLNRLQKYLKGDALKSVSSLLLDPHNIKAIIDRLENRFGRVETVYAGLIKDIFQVKNPRYDNPQSFIDFIGAIGNLVTNMNSLNHPEYLNDQRLLRDLSSKLPGNLRGRWLESLEDQKALAAPQAVVAPTISEFYDWLKPHENLATILSSERPPRNERVNTSERPQRYERINQVNFHNKNYPSPKCIICKSSHKTTDCLKFKQLDIVKRRELASKEKLCYACCNSTTHVALNCKFSKPCKIDGCGRRHHPLLHLKQTTYFKGGKEAVVNCHLRKNKIFYEIVPVVLKNHDKEIETFAFLDSGSSVSLMQHDLIKKLGVIGIKSPMTLAWTNGKTIQENMSHEVNIEIRGMKGRTYTLNNINTVENLSLPNQSLDREELLNRYPYLKGIDIAGYSEANPKLLLGQPHAYLMVGMEGRSRGFNEPIARKTKLGWVVHGQLNLHSNKEIVNNIFMINEFEDDDELSMKEMMAKYFTTEGFGVKVPSEQLLSKQDERAIETMKATTKEIDKGYEIGLLWKDEKTSFPNSFQAALARLLLQERKMKNNPVLRTWYNSKIDEYVQKGYASKMSPKEYMEETPKTFYLPHFVVTNENKLDRKHRLVFDAAAKVEGVSLNSKLLTGPDSTESLLGILLRFRENAIAITGDIQEMFHRIAIREKDRESQRFLFRHDSNTRLNTYVMNVMTFGATCSPACAQYVKNFNAMKYKEKYPLAVTAIIKNHYVDNYLDSYDNLDLATKVTKNVIEIHEEANFRMRDFVSNSAQLMKNLPADRLSKSENVCLGNPEEAFEKVLGLIWDFRNDKIKINLKLPDSIEERPTKRKVLSTAMSVYDPLGLISNITIESRIIMQELWKPGIGWDDVIPVETYKKWKKWLKRLSTLKDLEFNRCYSLSPNIYKRDLHIFCDASESAFACVIYLVSTLDRGVDVSLVAAKSRVAPTKSLTIPRLELQAAVMGTRLANSVSEQLRLPISRTIFWSDSTTVLSWINSEARKYKTFVQHRIAEILETTTEEQWHYVNSENNPADEGTKVITNNSIWISGPSFLKEPESNWPSNKIKNNSEEEMRPMFLIQSTNSTNQSIFNINWCSDWTRLKRAICIAIKYIDWLKSKAKGSKFDPQITAKEMQNAEKLLIKQAQKEDFPEEVFNLTNNFPLNEDSNIRNLTPVMHPDGVLRSDTRYKNASCCPYETKFPCILSRNHHVTWLILKHYHEKFKHQKMNTVLAEVAQKYHIIFAKQSMKSVKARCQFCKNKNAKPQVPKMAALPRCRIEPYYKPFTFTGVDYFGPFIVSIGRRTEKRWGVLFTCMTTRAIYLDLAYDLSADSFMICLNNLQARRGRVSELYSDNGTNFIGANNEMKAIQYRLANTGIQWHFIPPASPHFGGAWERLVKEVKSLLPTNTMPEHVLRGLLIQAEKMINSRPLTHISLDSEDDEPLTPNHFLIGCSGDSEPSLNDVTNAEATRKHWKKVQKYARSLWDRWIKEYLPSLGKRSKWNKDVPPLQVGDIVMIMDEDRKGNWKKGTITEIHTGQDGQVRSAVVKTLDGETKRPACKLAVLDVGHTRNNDRNTSRFVGTIQLKKRKFEIKKAAEITQQSIPGGEKRKRQDDDNMMELASQPKFKKLKTNACSFANICLVLYCILAIFGQALCFEKHGLIAYDCGNPEVNMTSYSLLDVASCIPPSNNLTTDQISIQVLQRSVRTTTKVFQCKIIIKRSIKHCGAFSHVSEYQNGFSYIVKELSAEECRKVHSLGTVALTHDRFVNELKLNATTHGETLIVGSILGSKCYGGTYSTPSYTWTDALVFYEYEISLYDYVSHVDIENDQVHLRNGLQCPYSRGRCLDSEEGYLTWDINMNKSCEETEFEVIFEGLVNKTTNSDSEKNPSTVIYSTISETQVFTVKTRKPTRICGYMGFTTDHPRILIIETKDIKSPFIRKADSGKNLDLFTYFNSKITLVENYIGQNLNDVYNMVMTEICNLDRTIMETKLTLARLNPNEFVTSIMKGNGYTAVVAGEVLHVVECKPVYVTPRASNRCYQELPVNYNNITMFLAPVTRVLQTRGTEIDCTPLLPAKFKFGSRWYTTDGRLRESISPNKLSTDIITSWTYTPLPNLMESGVYDSDSLEKMRNLIYEQGERRAASSVVYKVIAGHHPNRQGFHFEALISEQVLDNVFNKYWNKFISWTTWLGNLTSTALGLYLVSRIVKFLIDTIIHGRILYDIYGLSWKLIASIWDSLTNLLSHKKIMTETRNLQQTHDKFKQLDDVQNINGSDKGEDEPYRANLYPSVNTQQFVSH